MIGNMVTEQCPDGHVGIVYGEHHAAACSMCALRTDTERCHGAQCTPETRADGQNVFFVKKASITQTPAVRSATDRRQAIIDCLYEHGPLTRLQIAAKLGVPINCVTAPVLELLKTGELVEHDLVLQETGRKAWRVRVRGGDVW